MSFLVKCVSWSMVAGNGLQIGTVADFKGIIFQEGTQPLRCGRWGRLRKL